MATKEKTVYHVRDFICPKTSQVNSFIDAVVVHRTDEYIGDDAKAATVKSVEASLNIADCNRTVYLSFDVWSFRSKTQKRKELKAMRAKVAKFKKITDEFFEALEEQYDALEEAMDESK